jgi:hypothetical protein
MDVELLHDEAKIALNTMGSNVLEAKMLNALTIERTVSRRSTAVLLCGF